MNIKIVCIIAGVLLLIAIPTGLPYDFYILLRWIICGISIFTSYGFYKSKLSGWSVTFGAIAFLFNPLFPVHLEKSSWVSIDFISAILFFIAGYSSKKDIKNG